MTSIRILVGTVYGGALHVARSISGRLEAEGIAALVVESPTLDDLTGNNDPILICTSTTGQGELPQNLLPFYTELREKLPLQKDRAFGVVVLGDSSYGDTFCGAGALMEEAFHEINARKVGAVLRIDAMETTDPEELTIPWATDWAARLRLDHPGSL